MKVALGRWLRAVMAMLWLVTAAACAKSDDAWESAVKTDTPDAYASFLERHPKSEYAEQARARRDALIDERDWNTARRENTAEAYAKYLSVHSEGVWSELAARRRTALISAAGAGDSVPVQAPAAMPEPPPPPTPAASTAPAAEAAAAPRIVQLGAFSSAPSAKKGWARLQASFTELSGLSPLIDAQPLRGSSLYRLRLQLASDEEADRLCAVLIRGGAECIKMESP